MHDFLALGALVTRLDPGIIPFKEADTYTLHVSGGEYNVACNLSTCFGMRTAVASAMVFLLGHEPEAEVNSLYCDWLKEFNKELPRQLLLEGTDMASKYRLTQAVWMLQASLLLEPECYETHYNLALAYNQLGTRLTKEEKYLDASECYSLAEQYFQNASQLENTQYREGGKLDEGYDTGLYREW